MSTTVIEVGIDQPNATLLIVENAERFGLSQLHQLRGRVGRSQIQSYCVLVSDSDDPLVRRRLTALCKTARFATQKRIYCFAVQVMFSVFTNTAFPTFASRIFTRTVSY